MCSRNTRYRESMFSLICWIVLPIIYGVNRCGVRSCSNNVATAFGGTVVMVPAVVKALLYLSSAVNEII